MLKAVLSGNIDMVKLFIERGVGVNDTDLKGTTPLYMAVFKGDQKMVSFLLEIGADPWIKG